MHAVCARAAAADDGSKISPVRFYKSDDEQARHVAAAMVPHFCGIAEAALCVTRVHGGITNQLFCVAAPAAAAQRRVRAPGRGLCVGAADYRCAAPLRWGTSA